VEGGKYGAERGGSKVGGDRKGRKGGYEEEVRGEVREKTEPRKRKIAEEKKCGKSGGGGRWEEKGGEGGRKVEG